MLEELFVYVTLFLGYQILFLFLFLCLYVLKTFLGTKHGCCFALPFLFVKKYENMFPNVWCQKLEIGNVTENDSVYERLPVQGGIPWQIRPSFHYTFGHLWFQGRRHQSCRYQPSQITVHGWHIPVQCNPCCVKISYHICIFTRV